MLKTGEMLKMLKFVFEKMLKTGETLKMSKDVKVAGETLRGVNGKPPQISPATLTSLTSLTFPGKC